MGIVGRSARRVEWEKQLEHLSPIKKTLYRAQPYTCTDPTCFVNGRAGVNPYCTACGGTGYTGVTAATDNSHLLKAPAAKVFYLYGDVQPGHGLYGSGGDFLRAIVDLGRLPSGDATLFTKVQEFDRASGTLVHPDVQNTRVRPDYFRGADGSLYTVTHGLIVTFGDEMLCRIFTLERGLQGAK